MNKEELKKIARKLVEEHAAKELREGFQPEGLHIYDDKQRNILYFRLRLKHPDGRKWIRPFHFDDINKNWVMKELNFTDGKPLYHLSILENNPNKEVWITEGELKVDLLEKFGLLATTSGSSASATSANWKPLEGRSILIWRDCDDVGLKYAQKVTEILRSLDCTIRYIDVEKLNLSEGGDIVDWLEANPNATKKDILSLPMLEDLVNDNENDNEKIINDLAKLAEIDYQHQRKDTAKRLQISVKSLDALVKKVQKDFNAHSSEIFYSIDPWQESINGKTLFDEIEHLINRFISFPSEHEVKAIVLYTIHTHCIDSSYCSPILNINSPEKRCGKTTLLSVLQQLVNRPLIASSISAAAVYRAIEKWNPTLIIDEGDTFLSKNDEIRGVINSGHTRDSAYVIRCVGDDHEPTKFNTWCPKIIAAIGHLPETLEDRSIIIQLRRKLNSEKKDKLRDVSKTVFDELLRKIVRFAVDNTEHLKKITPPIPETLNDRAGDNWMSLLAIATLAGDEWFKAATEAAIYLSGTKQEPRSVGVELLQDIKNIFDTKKIDRLYTSELLDALCSESEAPWSTYNRGKPLSARQLANRLKEYKIHSKDMRIPPYNKNLKGYSYDDFLEAFSRYLPASPSCKETESATTRQSNDDVDLEVFSMSCKNNVSQEENVPQSTSHMVYSAVADKYPNSVDRLEEVEMRRVEL